jgi:hypothetical protein
MSRTQDCAEAAAKPFISSQGAKTKVATARFSIRSAD